MSIPDQQNAPEAQSQQQPYGWVAPVPEQGKNGFAVAALVFGILGGIPLALIFGIVGLVRSKKAGKGKVMSWIGILLALLWIVPIALLVPHVLKATDAGCLSATASVTSSADKLNADGNDPAAMKADLQNVVTQLNGDAGKAGNSAARTSIQALAGDYQQLLDSLTNGTAPSSDLTDRMTADANKVDSACGKTVN
ncbi:hypothetical protein P3T36_006288 [Kitasatospora sp. MAP12-15]|uniref:DUF4190 domain-containing protein n=1 Tax=unclassified Kitasatospora TaxID=2633591 RepID=UPI0024738F26|nr:DUF4190 domain-containing protein [Kitasatospora sp. MAP12-44]MDH6108919.1 hypothetical protein [Kitasatospora sp. MAP12-44]